MTPTPVLQHCSDIDILVHVQCLVDAVAKDTEGSAKVGKVDIDSQQELARTYDIKSLPTIVFFKGGEVKDTIIGTKGVSADSLKEKLAALA